MHKNFLGLTFAFFVYLSKTVKDLVPHPYHTQEGLLATSAYIFYTDVSSFLSGSHIRALHHQYSSSPSSSCSLITWTLQILSVFSYSFFFSTQMIAKHPLPADSPNSLTVQMSQTSNTEQILHSQIQDITKLKSPSLLWYTYTVKAKLSLGSSSSKKLSPKCHWYLLTCLPLLFYASL